MKYQLSIENSEIYRNLPLYPFHKRYKNVRNDLMQLHPGFTDESIWDFQADKKGITACVISRDFYEEKRIFHPLCRFVAMEEGKKRRMKEIEFFKWPGYTKDGKRRKRKGIIIAVIIAGICAATAFFSILRKGSLENTVTENPSVYEPENLVINMPGLSSLTEECITVINKWGGQISFLESSRSGDAICRFGVFGGNVSACVQELESLETMEKVSCENLTWVSGKWEYIISCFFSGTPYERDPDIWKSDFLSCFSKGEACIKETGSKLSSSYIDEGNNLVFFSFMTDEKADAAFLKNLETKFFDAGCILESLKVSPYLENNRNGFIVETGLREFMEGSVLLEKTATDADSFIWKKNLEITEEQPFSKHYEQELAFNKGNKSYVDDKNEDSGSTEIGRIKQGNIIIAYYRNNDGKIYTKKLGE